MKIADANELKEGALVYFRFHSNAMKEVQFVRVLDNRRLVVKINGKNKIRAIQTLEISKNY
jgi:hypothetical protein